MGKISIAVLSGLLLVGIIGTVSYAMQSFTIFVISSLVAAGASFIPLLINIFRNNGGAKPTLFGTSSPGTFTTISHAQNSKASKAIDSTAWIAAVGGLVLICILLIALFSYL